MGFFPSKRVTILGFVGALVIGGLAIVLARGAAFTSPQAAGRHAGSAKVEREPPKQDDSPGVASRGWFAFEPPPDPFGAAALDLRDLNDAFAGEQGFIKAKGNSFVYEKTGTPVRFWAVNVGHGMLNKDGASLDRLARHLAKIGVNMVRLHGPLWREDDITQLDQAKLAKVHRLVAALKRQGIYLALSSYFPAWLQPKDVRGLDGYHGDQKAFALSFFNRRVQDLQKGWWEALLRTNNPYTKLKLVDDPTLAFIEIQNEDSMFFWTFKPYQDVPGPQMEVLEGLFGDWLKTKYGGVVNAFAHWPATMLRGDDAAAGRAGFMPLWDIVNKRDARAKDTSEFLARLQRRYYDGMAAYLKQDLGFKGSVTGSNWITADGRLLGPLDKWSNAGCDFMDRHGYYGGPHEGERAGYLLSNGDLYNDASALLFQTGKGGEISYDLPLMDLAYNDKPSTISEISWVPPNRYRTEMPVLTAAYGALQGSDAFFFFADDEVGWTDHLQKFSITDPAVMGQFPAAALIFRKGLVRTADAVLRLEERLSDLLHLQGIPISAPQNVDEFRRTDLPRGDAAGSGQAARVNAIDPLAFLAGRVEVNITEEGGVSHVVDLSKLIDRPHSTVRSSTGELVWDYGRGFATINAPSAQGVTGFLSKAGTVALDDVTITSPLEYGSILLVSLDDRPLKSSHKMLLQVMSEDTNAGWSAPGKGLRTIANIGGPPVVVKTLEGQVSLKRAGAGSLRVIPLDFNGYRTGQAIKSAKDITLLPTTLYYSIEQ